MKLSIILLNYKRKELTVACVTSLYTQYKKQLEKDEFEVLIVDNLSEDGSVEFLKKALEKKKWKNVHLYANTENVGFGKGNNLGVSHAKGEYLLFLNNDTQVLDTGFVGMVDFMDSRPRIGILGGKMENKDRTPQASAGKFYTLFKATMMLLGAQRLGLIYNSPREIKKVDWVSGGCMMVRKSVFEKIGGFDPNIFMYVEDVDLCYRAKKEGLFTFYYPFVSVLHQEQGSSNRTFAIVHIYEGLLYFYNKHMAPWQVWVLTCILKAKAVFLIFFGKLFGKSYLVSTYEQALNIFR